MGSQTEAAFAYRRHTDDFVLLRDDPAIYENNHIDGSWQASLRRTENLPAGALLLMGLEADGDSIRSNNLGLHARNRGAGYVDLDLRPAKKRWSLSAGAREEIFSGGAQAVFSPELAGSFRVASSLKLRASGGYGFRIPTYTDLYYSDPSTLGNPNLKPESAWIGRWRRGLDAVGKGDAFGDGILFAAARHDRLCEERDGPNPYLPAGCPANIWCADNLNGLHFAGVETSFTWIPKKSQTVRDRVDGVARGADRAARA